MIEQRGISLFSATTWKRVFGVFITIEFWKRGTLILINKHNISIEMYRRDMLLYLKRQYSACTQVSVYPCYQGYQTKPSCNRFLIITADNSSNIFGLYDQECYEGKIYRNYSSSAYTVINKDKIYS